MTKKIIKVIELFAGVGGFRLGLEGFKGKSSISGYKKPLKNKIPFKVYYSNQFEPKTPTKQYANEIYEKHFTSKNHFGIDINDITKEHFKVKCDVLVGGFPCQNYSVASLLRDAKGLIGDKGVLWWQIEKILHFLKKEKKAPDYLLLENVDRLLLSPTPRPGETSFKGRDFAIILSSLRRYDYNVEWRVINAADYGFPQKRKRIFIFAFKNDSKIYKKFKKISSEEIIFHNGIIAKAFPCERKHKNKTQNLFACNREIVKDRKKYMKKYSEGKFLNAGVMINGKVMEFEVTAHHDYSLDNDMPRTLGDIILPISQISREFIIPNSDINKWRSEKKGHHKPRTAKDGTKYDWKVGNMEFPDSLERPSRTIVTSEGSKSASRITHIIKQNKIYRRLTPIELERLNLFPDDFTKSENISDTKRAFLMGNALVVGIIQKIGSALSAELES